MKGNYNDIIDIILTLQKNETINKNIIISGSIVPYLLLNKESSENHTDLYILVNEQELSNVRKEMKKIYKEYLIDIISDSRKMNKTDYGFKMKYENTFIGFFPYEFLNNNFILKTYSVNKSKTEIFIKTKKIISLTKTILFRKIMFNNKLLTIMSPEYVLVDKESREKEPGNPTIETMNLLNKICDESILKIIRKSFIDSKIELKKEKIKKNIFNI